MDPIRSLGTGLWVIDHPFSMPGGIHIGTRTTIIRLSSGELWVHSPGPLTAETKAWLEEHGPVGAIVAPNLLHHMFVSETAAAFPDATVYGPEGLGAKIDIGYEIIDVDKHPWQGDLDCVLVGGCPRMNEIVFLHPKSRTLVVTDLAFNFHDVDSFMTRMFLRINGSLGRFGPSRLAKSFFFGDHAEVAAAVRRILEWDFDRIVLTHGDVLESGGPSALREGYRSMLG